eukprot:scaffold128895_cov33-Tisochrysis_lutea.AAC.2
MRAGARAIGTGRARPVVGARRSASAVAAHASRSSREERGEEAIPPSFLLRRASTQQGALFFCREK